MAQRSVWLVRDLDIETGLGHIRMVASSEDAAYHFANTLEKACEYASVGVIEVELDSDLAEGD